MEFHIPGTKPPGSKWVVWSLAALFYFYEYLLRISPSVMVPELMQTFAANAGIIGLLTAFYLYAYSPMQLPVGVLMDQFGVRKLLTFASVICGLGALFFGVTDAIWIACLGRLLMGAGSAFAFVGMVFVCSHWFPKKKQALVIGLANSIGMLGAVFGGGPLSMAVHAFDYRPVMITLGFVGIALGFAIFLAVRREPTHFLTSGENRHILKYLKMVIANPYTWLNGFVAVLFYIVTTTVGGLWGVPFLEAAYGWSTQAAAFGVSMLFIGWMAGGPLTGLVSDFIRKKQPVISMSIFLTLVLTLALIYIRMHPVAVYLTLFLIGFFSSAELLCFTYAIEVNSHKAKGTSIAFTNCLIALVGSIMQPVIGFLLVQKWHGNLKEGVPIYDLPAYHYALAILPIMLIIAFVLSLFLNERKFDPQLEAPLL